MSRYKLRNLSIRMHTSKIIRSVLILGGTGKTGKLILQEALNKGYLVTALARNPDKFNGLGDHPHLEILKGDVLNYADVYNAVQGNDAIVSALGPDGEEVKVLTAGTANMLRAMNQSSIQKIICLSSLGAGSTRKLADWKLKWMIQLGGLRASFEAKAEQELMLLQSSVNFTLVMAGTLKDSTTSDHYLAFLPQQASSCMAMPPSISRSTVANFMIDQLSMDTWRRKTVCLSGESS
jgi:putative NADH-flavin reductase